MKKVLYILFHRSVVVGLSLLAQVVSLIVMVMFFSGHTQGFYWCCIALSVVAAMLILGSSIDPAYKIAWLLLVLPFPVFGGIFYLLVGGGHIPKRITRRMKRIAEQSAENLKADFKADDLLPLGEDAASQARYLENYACCPAYTNTETEYFALGDLAFPRMLEELKKAKHYIFLEYFIIQPGKFWDSILDILEEKAAQGVEVRLIYDDMGCMFTLPRDYNEQMAARGIQCRVFNRFVPVMSLRLNNRDHRKLMIIDGQVGFTGGINLADEYINQKLRYGHWKDTAILLKGEAVWSMTVMFLTMWEYTRDVEEDYRRFRPDKLPPEAAQGAGYYVQPYADNPLDEEAVGEAVYLNLINKAERYVYAMTPYLIISDSVNTALCNAAKSGVDVRIITPHIPDKALVFELTRSHYESLLEAGVQIFEYTPGFVHAKVMVTDDCCGVVGSINLDYRSMFLHFEDAVLLYHDPTVLDIKRDFINTQFRSQPVTLEQCLGHSWIRRLFRSILRVLAPLL